jgi:hypothetical protein
MAASVNVELILPQRTGTEVYASLFKDAGNGGTANGALNFRSALQRFINLLVAIVSGIARGRLRVGIDDSTGVSATGTIACTQASCTAGDKIWIDRIAFTAVSGTPDLTLGQFAIITSDSAVATSLAAAINGYPAARGKLSASPSSGTVTVTYVPPGTPGNSIRMFKEVTTAGAFTLSGTTLSGGRDPGDKQSLTAALSGVIANNDTITIGSVVLTGKSSGPSGESQFLCNVSAAADGAALVACINAHSKLKGLILASGTSTPSLQLLSCGRIGAIIGITKSCANMTLSAASWAPTTTEAWAASPVELAFGAL